MKIKFKYTLESLPAILEYAGVKPTAQRLAVARYLFLDADHPTADEVKAAVDRFFPKISLATVYNTLHALEAGGLLKAVKRPDSGKVVYDRNTTHHHHFIDRDSGEILDIPAEQVAVEAELPNEFHIDEVEVFIRGTRD